MVDWKIMPTFFVSREDIIVRQYKINANLFCVLLTYSYLCK
jgi:hypothetical protein